MACSIRSQEVLKLPITGMHLKISHNNYTQGSTSKVSSQIEQKITGSLSFFAR